jgi:hypothetical protein
VAAVSHGQPAKVSTTKARNPVFDVDDSDSSSLSEATSSNSSSSHGSAASENENSGKKCHKQVKEKEVVLLSSESSDDE